jgi:hypothetical protein
MSTLAYVVVLRCINCHLRLCLLQRLYGMQVSRIIQPCRHHKCTVEPGMFFIPFTAGLFKKSVFIGYRIAEARKRHKTQIRGFVFLTTSSLSFRFPALARPDVPPVHPFSGYRSYSARDVKLTTHLQVLMEIMCGAIPPLPRVFMS